MKLVWDEPKRVSNLDKHGLDFADLTLEFFEGAVYRPGHSGRLRAIGYFNGQLVIAVVFRPLGSEAVSIISMRPANRVEKEVML
jgi:uncharacterized DUF497 family protein